MQPPELPGRFTQRQPTPQGEFWLSERHGAAVAHASGLLVGVPLIVLGLLFVQLPPAFAYTPSPIVAYLIARSYRRRRMAWGAFQGMQATLVQLIILFLMFPITLWGAAAPGLVLLLPLVAMLLFLYSLWGAWDTLFGADFRYIGINRLMRHVSAVNLQRQERRRRFGQPYRIQEIEKDDKPPREG